MLACLFYENLQSKWGRVHTGTVDSHSEEVGLAALRHKAKPPATQASQLIRKCDRENAWFLFYATEFIHLWSYLTHIN